MNHRAFRFLQAGDFHLEAPMTGLAEIPDHLVDLLIDAPYASAARAFETALAEEVEFVLLAGDLLDLKRCGPRGPVFLRDQFARLAAAEIPVFWILSSIESLQWWPEAVPLPSNVHRFAAGRVEERVVSRRGEPLVRLIACGTDEPGGLRINEFSPDRTGLFTLALVRGTLDRELLAQRQLHYWALGGPHRWTIEPTATAVVHVAGAAQGRGPHEPGAHGVSLVHVDDGTAQPMFVATDVVRWETPRLEIDDLASVEELDERLGETANRLLEEAGGLDLLIRWTLAGRGALVDQLRRPGGCESLLESLRDSLGRQRPAVWSAAIEIERLGGLPAEWYEEQSFRGDVLRLLRHWEVNGDLPLDLADYLRDCAGIDDFAATDPIGQQREVLLRRAALTAVDLLSDQERRK